VLTDVKIQAEPRSVSGKRVSRKLARLGRVPGVLYGGGGETETFEIDPRRLEAILHSETGTNTLFQFSVDGKKAGTLAIIKQVQVDPADGTLIHADLMRISMDRLIEVKVPIHISGTARGVKTQGGILDFVLREIEVSCLPGDIPDRIDADVSDLDLGKSIKVADLKISDKVKVLTDPNKSVAVVVTPAAEKSAEAAAAEAAVPEGPAEPEVIKKGKAETAEGAEAEASAKGEKPAKEKPEKEKGGKEKGGR
jgi:large subunit ribosomal protein L25